MTNPKTAKHRRAVAASAIQPDGYPRVRPFDPREWPGADVETQIRAYAHALMVGKARQALADATLRTYTRQHGYGKRQAVLASVPTFEPTGSERLRVALDAFKYVQRHGLAVDPLALAREWLDKHGDSFEPGDAPPTERERFGF